MESFLKRSSIFLFPHATFVCVCVLFFWSNQRNDNQTQTKTHEHIQMSTLGSILQCVAFPLKGREGSCVPKFLTKDLSHPTRGVSHPVFCKPIPETKMPERR